jgi:hypothetical protein
MSDVVMLRYALATGNPAVETGEAFEALARVDRGLAHLAVNRLQRLADLIQVEVTVNAPEHVTGERVRRGRNHRTAAQALS